MQLLFPTYDAVCGPFQARSPQWDSVRDAWIMANPACVCCGRRSDLVAHHVKPFHLFPDLELSVYNLVTLCTGGPLNCHFLAGHAGRSWSHYSPNIALAVEQVRSAVRLLKLGAE